MAYVWGNQGAGFEYPPCFRVENRVLTLRAAALLLCALIVLWLALSDPDGPGSATVLAIKPERGSAVPHVVMALALLVLGVIDLVTAARQRRVLLLPGQPASLAPDLMRQSSGTSAGARWLFDILNSSMVPEPRLDSPYQRGLLALSPTVARAPVPLQEYLRVRIAHLLFAFGLLLVLGLTWAVASSRPALPLAALLYAALAAAMAARTAWITQAAPSPLAAAVALATTGVAGLAVAFFAGGIPHVAKLAQLALPAATALVLVCMLAIEGLALLAARAQIAPEPVVDLRSAGAAAEFVAEPGRLMQEVERELHRYWADGVPNRRHAWEPPAPGADGHATVLEETQPMPPADGRGNRRAPMPIPGEARVLALDVLGLLLAIAGGVLWVRLTWIHMADAAASWATAPAAVVLIVAGGYAVRVAHLLWTRVEVESLLLRIEFEPAESAASAPEGSARVMRLCTLFARARSTFHTGADHPIGSRTLLSLTGEEASAKRFVQTVRGYAERASLADAAARERPGLAPPAAAVHAQTPPRPASGPAAGQPLAGAVRGAPRFCSNCGTPVLSGARFCQQCGHALHPG